MGNILDNAEFITGLKVNIEALRQRRFGNAAAAQKFIERINHAIDDHAGTRLTETAIRRLFNQHPDMAKLSDDAVYNLAIMTTDTQDARRFPGTTGDITAAYDLLMHFEWLQTTKFKPAQYPDVWTEQNIAEVRKYMESNPDLFIVYPEPCEPYV